MREYLPVSDHEVDMQVRGFLSGMGITVTEQVVWRHTGMKYRATYKEFELRIRVATKQMLLGHRLIYIELIHNDHAFQIIGLDTQNKIAPSPEHIDNLDVGLASVVYQKV
jgi:hypothetical protein